MNFNIPSIRNICLLYFWYSTSSAPSAIVRAPLRVSKVPKHTMVWLVSYVCNKPERLKLRLISFSPFDFPFFKPSKEEDNKTISRDWEIVWVFLDKKFINCEHKYLNRKCDTVYAYFWKFCCRIRTWVLFMIEVFNFIGAAF